MGAGKKNTTGGHRDSKRCVGIPQYTASQPPGLVALTVLGAVDGVPWSRLG